MINLFNPHFPPTVLGQATGVLAQAVEALRTRGSGRPTNDERSRHHFPPLRTRGRRRPTNHERSRHCFPPCERGAVVARPTTALPTPFPPLRIRTFVAPVGNRFPDLPSKTCCLTATFGWVEGGQTYIMKRKGGSGGGGRTAGGAIDSHPPRFQVRGKSDPVPECRPRCQVPSLPQF